MPELGLGVPLAERERGTGGVREASWVKQSQECRGDRGEGLGDGKDPGLRAHQGCSLSRRWERAAGAPGEAVQPRGSRTDTWGDLGETKVWAEGEVPGRLRRARKGERGRAGGGGHPGNQRGLPDRKRDQGKR